MTGVLLDTNALIWVLTGDPRLGEAARRSMAETPRVYYSAVSALEITIKEMLGRLQVPGDLTVAGAAAGLTELPFTAGHGIELGSFPPLARHDPFDRMLLSQAHVEGLRLLTSDTRLLALNLEFLADARA